MSTAHHAQRIWLITGSSSGLGKALAVRAARNDIVFAGTRNVAAVPPEDFAGLHNLRRVRLDPADPAAAIDTIAEIEAAHGGIDIVVNNAGYGMIGAVEETSDAEVRALFDVNFFFPATIMRAALPGMRRRRSGTIINISSLSGVVAPAGSAAYAASKFAVEGLSEGLRRECQPLGIHVMIVEPGAMATEFFGGSRVFSQARLADYELVEARRREPGTGKAEVSDPGLCAEAIFNALARERPPGRLILGGQGATKIESALQERLEELREYRALSASTAQAK